MVRHEMSWSVMVRHGRRQGRFAPGSNSQVSMPGRSARDPGRLRRLQGQLFLGPWDRTAGGRSAGRTSSRFSAGVDSDVVALLEVGSGPGNHEIRPSRNGPPADRRGEPVRPAVRRLPQSPVLRPVPELPAVRLPAPAAPPPRERPHRPGGAAPRRADPGGRRCRSLRRPLRGRRPARRTRPRRAGATDSARRCRPRRDRPERSACRRITWSIMKDDSCATATCQALLQPLQQDLRLLPRRLAPQQADSRAPARRCGAARAGHGRSGAPSARRSRPGAPPRPRCRWRRNGGRSTPAGSRGRERADAARLRAREGRWPWMGSDIHEMFQTAKIGNNTGMSSIKSLAGPAPPEMYPSPASAGEVAPDLSGVDGGVRPACACACSAPYVCSHRTPTPLFFGPPPLKRIALRNSDRAKTGAGAAFPAIPLPLPPPPRGGE